MMRAETKCARDSAPVFLALLLMFIAAPSEAQTRNGFDLSESLIPAKEIRYGGVPRDGIPAIDEPEFIDPADAEFLKPDDRILGIFRNGIARAYPIRILDHHEVVNDEFDGEGILVSYCPLCNTGMAFAVQGSDIRFTFGVSGLLYNSDVLFYDRQTGSLWSQIMAQAVTGPLRGTALPVIPVSHTSWRDWQVRHPDTRVLSTNTGYRRDYSKTQYRDYRRGSSLMFPVAEKNRSYDNKELTLGVTIGGISRAYPFAELSQLPGNSLRDKVGGTAITVEWSEKDETARVLDENGDEVPSLIAYWFAWYAFHPDTEIFRAPD